MCAERVKRVEAVQHLPPLNHRGVFVRLVWLKNTIENVQKVIVVYNSFFVVFSSQIVIYALQHL